MAVENNPRDYIAGGRADEIFQPKADPRRVTRSTMDGTISSGRRPDAGEQEVSTLQEILHRIHNASSNAGIVLARLDQLGDRAFGEQPKLDTQEGLAKVRVCDDGMVDRVFLALGELDRVLARLDSAQSRVHGLA